MVNYLDQVVNKELRRGRQPDQARATILEAALTEFAERGYGDASTNTIAAQAGVAKGLVFHHYGDKASLLAAVLDHIFDDIEAAFDDEMAKAPADPIGRVLAWTQRKAWMMREDPRPTQVLVGLLTQAPPDVAQAARTQGERRMRALRGRLLEGADLRSLRGGLEPEALLDTVWTVAAGLEQSLLPQLARSRRRAARKVIEGALDRAESMFALIRRGAYQEDDDGKT